MFKNFLIIKFKYYRSPLKKKQSKKFYLFPAKFHKIGFDKTI